MVSTISGFWMCSKRGSNVAVFVALLAATGATQCVVEGAEPNSSFAAPFNATTVGDGMHAEGVIDVFQDTDGYFFTLTQRTRVSAFVGPSAQVAARDMVLELFDLTNMQLGLVLRDDERGLHPAMDRVLETGSYGLDVRAFQPTDVGGYTLDVIFGVPPAFNGAEGSEPNQSLATATAIPLDSRIVGDLQPGGLDSDYYSFTLARPTLIRAFTLEGPGPSPFDTTLELFDAAGVSIVYDDDSGQAEFALIERMLASGTYYLDVQDFGSAPGGGGSYELMLLAPEPFQSATFAASAGGCAGTAGTPRLFAAPLEVPVLGSTVQLVFEQLPAHAVVVPFFGLSNQSANGGTVPLPFDLTSFGAAGCFVEVDPFSTTVVVAGMTGTATSCIVLPADPNLLGATLYHQAFVFDLGANAFGATVTNSAESVLGNEF